MIRLAYLPINAAFAFVFGDALLSLDGEDTFFQTRKAAIDAAARKRLVVKRGGVVEVQPEHVARVG